MATRRLSSISAGSESDFSVPAFKLRFIENGSEQGDPPAHKLLRIPELSLIEHSNALLLDPAMVEPSNVNTAAVFGLKVSFDALS
jgi:hypothetical protein